MKNKSIITITSVFLNLALFAILAHFNKLNSRMEGVPTPFIRVQQIPEIGYAQGGSHGIALASTVK